MTPYEVEIVEKETEVEQSKGSNKLVEPATMNAKADTDVKQSESYVEYYHHPKVVDNFARQTEILKINSCPKQPDIKKFLLMKGTIRTEPDFAHLIDEVSFGGNSLEDAFSNNAQQLREDNQTQLDEFLKLQEEMEKENESEMQFITMEKSETLQKNEFEMMTDVLTEMFAEDPDEKTPQLIFQNEFVQVDEARVSEVMDRCSRVRKNEQNEQFSRAELVEIAELQKETQANTAQEQVGGEFFRSPETLRRLDTCSTAEDSQFMELRHLYEQHIILDNDASEEFPFVAYE